VEEDGTDDSRIRDLIAERDAARKSRDFKRADAIRDELSAMGVVLEDTPDGVKWRRK
jgi:cysteinyl-tRNA synthetase